MAMRFLLTNDDGFGAPGLALLTEVAQEFGDVVVMAPDGALSGCSHRVTVEKPLTVTNHGRDQYSLNGTPADCVRMALVEQQQPIDWVLSGINAGANLGVDVYMSGTVGATREAGLYQVPAIALSLFIHHYGPFDWATVAPMARRVLEQLLPRRPATGGYFNVNFPDPRDVDESPGIVPCPLDPHPLPVAYHPAGQGVLYGIDYYNRPRDPGADVDICFGGQISLTEVLPVCAQQAGGQSLWRLNPPLSSPGDPG